MPGNVRTDRIRRQLTQVRPEVGLGDTENLDGNPTCDEDGCEKVEVAKRPAK